MLDMSMGVLLSGLILGGVGFVMFMYGKRESDFKTLFGGIALGVLPMAVHSLMMLWGLSAAVIGGILLLKKYGGGSAPLV